MFIIFFEHNDILINVISLFDYETYLNDNYDNIIDER